MAKDATSPAEDMAAGPSSSGGTGRLSASNHRERLVIWYWERDCAGVCRRGNGACGVCRPQAGAHYEIITTRCGAGRVVFIRCNVSAEGEGQLEADEEGLQLKEKAWGRADLLAKNVRERKGDWTSLFNAKGPLLGSKHAVARFLMQEPDAHDFYGTIVNISSIGGTVGLMQCSASRPSKAAIIGLAHETTIEYGDKGIWSKVQLSYLLETGPMLYFADLVCPKDIATPMLQPFVSVSPDFVAYLNASIAAGRLGKPADVARAVVWLASGRESVYVSDVVLPLDGGFATR